MCEKRHTYTYVHYIYLLEEMRLKLFRLDKVFPIGLLDKLY